MRIELTVPEIGESITDVEIAEWLKNPGETVKKDEPIATLESEKATVDLPSPAEGTLAQVSKQKGEAAKVGEVIGYLDAEAQAPASPLRQTQEPPPTSTPQTPPEPETAAAPKASEDTELAESVQTPEAMPLERSEETEQPAEPASATPKSPVAASMLTRPQTAGREEQVVPMSRLRRTLAERLVDAQNNSALLTTFNEIDMGRVQSLRKDYGDAFQKRHNTRLGLMSFFVKACVEALKLFPALNAEIRGTSVVYHNYYDIGIAVGSGRGLVVPVLRNSERMSFAQIETAIGDFARRAKSNKLKLDELQGGTFTISNGGIYGSLLSTPLINPPQSGVLGLHAIQERPVARDGSIVIRPMMYVALTYDHRLVDGREAVSGLKRIKEIIEDPGRMLLEI
jgi:2-oxoglutarate dehydrogenase E2 component (dihydrolipoamide succinyltransferase)